MRHDVEQVMLESQWLSQVHLDTKGKDVAYGQQPVPKEEIAERAVRNGSARLSQTLQLGGCEAGTMSHDGPVAQEACLFKEIDVPPIHLRMQSLGELHLARYHRESETCATQGGFTGARCYETRLATVPQK